MFTERSISSIDINKIIIFFRFINLPAWIVLGGWIGLQFVSSPQSFQSDGGGVAYLAHIGGFVAGVVLAAVVVVVVVAVVAADVVVCVLVPLLLMLLQLLMML